MKKFSKFLLIFALISFVLLGVLISCEEPEEMYDFKAWQVDSLNYYLAELGAEDAALEKQLGDGFELGTIPKGEGTVLGSDVLTALEGKVLLAGADIVTLTGKFEILEIAGVKKDKIGADLGDALEALLAAKGFKDAGGDYDGTKTVKDAFSLVVVVKVGFMDATKEVSLKYNYKKLTE